MIALREERERLIYVKVCQGLRISETLYCETLRIQVSHERSLAVVTINVPLDTREFLSMPVDLSLYLPCTLIQSRLPFAHCSGIDVSHAPKND